MTPLVEPLGSDLKALPRPGVQAESWGLLLVPVLLCVAMLVFAFATSAPAPEASTTSGSCVSSPESGPVAGC